MRTNSFRNPKALVGVSTLIFALVGFLTPIFSAPIILQQTNQFCDNRSVNDVNFGIGRFLTVTADLTPDGDLDGDGRADSDGVSLPSVVSAPGQPVYEFHVGNIGSDQTTFIDPPVAVGYDYQTGIGNPNFKSVLLPPIGDNMFDVYLWNGREFVFYATIRAGDEYPFPSGGVARFRILGIEPGLDPNNPTAFVTGLKFVAAGQFTGTMTPIIIPGATTVELKSGDGPNCINPRSKGVVTFSILGGEVDVTTINQASVEIDDDTNSITAGVGPVKTSINDVNGDGINDLVIQFNTQA